MLVGLWNREGCEMGCAKGAETRGTARRGGAGVSQCSRHSAFCLAGVSRLVLRLPPAERRAHLMDRAVSVAQGWGDSRILWHRKPRMCRQDLHWKCHNDMPRVERSPPPAQQNACCLFHVLLLFQIWAHHSVFFFISFLNFVQKCS